MREWAKRDASALRRLEAEARDTAERTVRPRLAALLEAASGAAAGATPLFEDVSGTGAGAAARVEAAGGAVAGAPSPTALAASGSALATADDDDDEVIELAAGEV